jgi:hypothetical protein
MDTFLGEGAPTTNYSTLDYIYILFIQSLGTNQDGRTIIKFDFSALPEGAVISAATLNLYYYAHPLSDAVGRTYWAYELTQTGWVEAQATWNIYSTGNSWATAGGDYTATDGASLVVPAAYGWMSWNVLALVQHFQSTHSKIAHFLLKDGAEENVTGYNRLYYTREYTTDTTLCPKLIITYTEAATPRRKNIIYY